MSKVSTVLVVICLSLLAMSPLNAATIPCVNGTYADLLATNTSGGGSIDDKLFTHFLFNGTSSGNPAPTPLTSSQVAVNTVNNGNSDIGFQFVFSLAAAGSRPTIYCCSTPCPHSAGFRKSPASTCPKPVTSPLPAVLWLTRRCASVPPSPAVAAQAPLRRSTRSQIPGAARSLIRSTSLLSRRWAGGKISILPVASRDSQRSLVWRTRLTRFPSPSRCCSWVRACCLRAFSRAEARRHKRRHFKRGTEPRPPRSLPPSSGYRKVPLASHPAVPEYPQLAPVNETELCYSRDSETPEAGA